MRETQIRCPRMHMALRNRSPGRSKSGSRGHRGSSLPHKLGKSCGGGGRDAPGRNENLSEATGTAGRLRWAKGVPAG